MDIDEIQREIQKAEDNFDKHFKYKGKNYKDVEDVLAAFILDEDRKPYDHIMYHTRSEYSGIQLTGVNQHDDSLWITQIYEHKQRPEIVEAIDTFNKLNAMSKSELTVYMAEKNFPKHYSYKGQSYDNQKEVFTEFILDENKKEGDVITYNTRSHDYGIPIAGVWNGEVKYTQISDDLQRPEIKDGAELFDKMKNNEVELRIQREEERFDKHYSYDGVRYDDPEDALTAFFEDENKTPNGKGVVLHTRNTFTGVQLTGTDNENKPWFTQMREDLIRPEVQECFNKFKEMAERFTVNKVKDIKDTIASFKEMRNDSMSVKKDKGLTL